jgi:hypothetical protein
MGPNPVKIGADAFLLSVLSLCRKTKYNLVCGSTFHNKPDDNRSSPTQQGIAP